jgi:hypothetical protein
VPHCVGEVQRGQRDEQKAKGGGKGKGESMVIAAKCSALFHCCSELMQSDRQNILKRKAFQMRILVGYLLLCAACAVALGQLEAEDKEYQKLYKERLDKQEREREMLVAKVTDIQSRQAHRATQLPPYKQFVPDEKIQAQFEVGGSTRVCACVCVPVCVCVCVCVLGSRVS